MVYVSLLGYKYMNLRQGSAVQKYKQRKCNEYFFIDLGGKKL